MSKKNFTGGINALLGDKNIEVSENNTNETEITLENAKALLDNILRLTEEPGKPKRGRPITQTKEVTKTSQEGTKENEIRATFILREELLEKLKAIAYWERLLIKDVVHSAIVDAISKYEAKAGEIKPIPKK
jgi:hypothetical protein